MGVLALLVSNWRAYLASALIGFGAAMWLTATIYQGRIDAMRVAQQTALIEAQTKVIETQNNQAKITAEVSHDYQAKIAALRLKYDRLHASTAGDSVSGLPDTPLGYNAATGRIQLPRGIAEHLRDLIFKADEQTQRLIACQDWIRKQTP